MLDSTLVMWGGEFGRTPVAELPQLSGRDHNHYGFSMWLAGGGVKGGYVHGATDEFGFAAVENKVHVHDLHATLLHLLGFDHDEADLPLRDLLGRRPLQAYTNDCGGCTSTLPRAQCRRNLALRISVTTI